MNKASATKTTPANAKKRINKTWLVVALLIGNGALLWFATPDDWAPKASATWLRLTEPGALSTAHAHLETDCASCHTSVRGAEALKCIACHANNTSLLKRQPTAFHANVGNCKRCHQEHRGRAERPTQMDHRVLTEIGLALLAVEDEDTEAAQRERLVRDRLRREVSVNPQLSTEEAVLNCATCHGNDDRHFALFGRDCAQCHLTQAWNLPAFVHPSATSRDCVQCHQAPPSHYMMHFKMISAGVAKKPHARLEQCYACHQTTAWFDIVDVGVYKHH